MIKVGILSFSDGRERVHNSLKLYIEECAEKIKLCLENSGEVEVYNEIEIIYDNEKAKKVALNIASMDLHAVILNIPVFAFPNFSLIAAYMQNVPCIAIAPVNGKLPGLGGLQAAVNMIRQTGMKCEKVWGNIDEPETLAQVMEFLHAAYAASTLKGQVYGLFGGRSIGMGSGAPTPDVWMKVFGIDVDHVDQLEIIRRAEAVEDEKVEKALKWLEENMGAICYDGDKLTTDSLKGQIKCYYAVKELVKEKKLNFIGVKCHYELSEYYYTQCLSAALFNDPYDWDGVKTPMIYSCEADSDGALTMQIMKLISQKPVLFFDFRHFDKKDGVFAFCNCGAASTWYASRSDEANDNLKKVKLTPVISKYGGKGCHVQYIAKEGEMTFGRLTRVLDRYKFTMFRGDIVNMNPDKVNETCPQWPHGFVKVKMDPKYLVDRYESNHIHGIYGDYIDTIKKFCELKGIEYEVIE